MVNKTGKGIILQTLLVVALWDAFQLLIELFFIYGLVSLIAMLTPGEENVLVITLIISLVIHYLFSVLRNTSEVIGKLVARLREEGKIE